MNNIQFTSKEGEQVFLDDVLMEMEIYLERARNVLQDVDETFFNYDPHSEEQQTRILISFENYRIKTEIAYDYAFRVYEKLQSLRKLVQEVQGE